MVTVDLSKLFPFSDGAKGYVYPDHSLVDIVIDDATMTTIDADYLYDTLHKIRTAKQNA